MEIEIAVEIDPAALIEPALEIELFPFYTAGSFPQQVQLIQQAQFPHQ